MSINQTTQSLFNEAIDFSKRTIRIPHYWVVGSDGMGDYYHYVEAAKIIQKVFVQAIISIRAEVINLEERKKSLSTFSIYHHIN